MIDESAWNGMENTQAFTVDENAMRTLISHTHCVYFFICPVMNGNVIFTSPLLLLDTHSVVLDGLCQYLSIRIQIRLGKHGYV